jgi:WD40 repeat protein
MRVLKTTASEILDVAFSPDCRAIAAADSRTVYLWNLDSPNLAPVRLDTDTGYRAGGLSFSACSRRLAWLSFDGRRCYDRDTRSAAVTVYPVPAVHGMHHSADATGNWAVSKHSFPDHCLMGWRRVEGEWVRQWKVSTWDLFVDSVVVAPGGDRFALFTRDGETEPSPWDLEVRDTTNAAIVATGSYPYSYAARPLRFHPHNEQVAGVNDMTLLVWQLPLGGDPRVVQNDNRKHFTALAYHPDGRRLFVTGNDKTVQVFDTRSLDRVTRYTWNLDRLSAVAVSPDGTLASAGSAGGDVVVWDLD